MTAALSWLLRGFTGAMLCALAACSTPAFSPSPSSPPHAGDNLFWSGRLALNIQSTPPQALSAGFTLKLRASDQGELLLLSPLGNTLAALQWQPGQASLQQGGQLWQDASPDALLTRLTGAQLPLAALIDWLQARPTLVPGWQVDWREFDSGRLSVQSTSTQIPPTTLRLIVEP